MDAYRITKIEIVMSKLIFNHKKGPFGDCTDLYELRFATKMTVAEFVSEVLSRKGEWGYIDFDNRRIEYRRGQLISGQLDDIKDREAMPVSAYGGWSRMDYELKLN